MNTVQDKIMVAEAAAQQACNALALRAARGPVTGKKSWLVFPADDPRAGIRKPIIFDP